MRVAILTRVSSEAQAAVDRLSLDAQERSMREKCDRLGWPIVSEFQAPGESAYTDDLAARPVLARALLAAERGEFDALMVYDVSRFARDQSLAHQSVRRLLKAGVSLFDAMTDMDYTAERFFFGINAAFAEHSSQMQGQKIASAKRQRYELGLHNGDVPFGYTKGPSTRDPLVVVPEEATAIREAFRMRAAGAGYQLIADWLNAAGHRPRSKQGVGRFGVSAVQSILENAFYHGTVKLKKASKRGAHEPIVTEDEWLRAQAVIRRRRGRNLRAGRNGLLTGLALCTLCASTLETSQRSGHGYYLERSKERGRMCANTNTSWRADEPDVAVAEVLLQLFTDSDWHAVTKGVRRTPGVASRRAELEKQRKRIRRFAIEGAIDEDEGLELMHEVNRELSKLPPDIAPLDDAIRRMSGMQEAWQHGTPEQKNALMKEVFAAVKLDTRVKSVAEIQVEPHPDLAALFAARREYVDGRGSTPGRNRTSIPAALVGSYDLAALRTA